jgi:hypothetical protein
MRDTSLGYADSDYASDFNRICNGDNTFGPSGCAMFSFEVYGGADRIQSDTYFQPSGKNGLFAFTNTIYLPSVLVKIQNHTPTTLIQV